MLNLIAKLAPLVTGMTKQEDGTPKPVSGEFTWLVRLPLLLGVVLVLVGLFGPGVAEDRRDDLYEVGFALLVGGPVVYQGRKRLTKGQVVAPAPVVAQPPPAQEPVPATDGDAAKKIENL